MSDKEEGKKTGQIDKKTSALLALEAKMIEKNQGIYNLENYIPDMFSEIEEVLSADAPERLLDQVELKTFQTLIQEHTGGERRKSSDRREKGKKSSGEERRGNDRRWEGRPRAQSLD